MMARKRNRFGESGLNVKVSLAGLLILLLLAACSSQPPAPVEDLEVNARVREPASEDSAGVQVYSLQNPAVKQLVVQAKGAEQTGNLDQAGGYLERALRIQPRDPQLLQHMAEIKLQKEDYQQALNFAVRSYDIGPRVGEICSRNWRTISVAREHLDDTNGASDAEARASQCMNTRPKAF
jgi:tetratricopeptide (TPR) repeat protein